MDNLARKPTDTSDERDETQSAGRKRPDFSVIQGNNQGDGKNQGSLHVVANDHNNDTVLPGDEHKAVTAKTGRSTFRVIPGGDTDIKIKNVAIKESSRTTRPQLVKPEPDVLPEVQQSQDELIADVTPRSTDEPSERIIQAPEAQEPGIEPEPIELSQRPEEQESIEAGEQPEQESQQQQDKQTSEQVADRFKQADKQRVEKPSQELPKQSTETPPSKSGIKLKAEPEELKNISPSAAGKSVQSVEGAVKSGGKVAAEAGQIAQKTESGVKAIETAGKAAKAVKTGATVAEGVSDVVKVAGSETVIVPVAMTAAEQVVKTGINLAEAGIDVLHGDFADAGAKVAETTTFWLIVATLGFMGSVIAFPLAVIPLLALNIYALGGFLFESKVFKQLSMVKLMIIGFLDAVFLIGMAVVLALVFYTFCNIPGVQTLSTIASYVAKIPGFNSAGDYAFCANFAGFSGGSISSSSGVSGGVYPTPAASGCSTTESGGCTRANISECPAMAAQMDNALRACNQESAGGQVAIASSTDKCQLPDGRYVSFSIGLWQINMLNSTQPEFPECQGALTQTSYDPTRCVTYNSRGECIVRYRTCSFGSRGQAGYDACRAALSDPARNTRQACRLFNSRGWQPWPYTRQVCNLP